MIADGITAHADGSFLRLVLDNLLGNAWDYCGKRKQAVIESGATENDVKKVYLRLICPCQTLYAEKLPTVKDTEKS
jgi:signal transduction histidine kinase